MAIQKFKLKSGTELTVGVAPFEMAISLVEAIKRTAVGSSFSKDSDIGDIIQSDTGVRRAVVATFPWVLYGVVQMSEDLFNDEKAGPSVRGDYYEIMLRVIEVNTHPFFSQISSE